MLKHSFIWCSIVLSDKFKNTAAVGEVGVPEEHQNRHNEFERVEGTLSPGRNPHTSCAHCIAHSSIFCLVDLEFSGKAGPAIVIDPSPSSLCLTYSTSIKVLIPICDFFNAASFGTSTWTSIRRILSPASPNPRLVFTPSSLVNIADQ